MPFSSRELSVLAYANGFTLWHYRTGDPAAALTAAGEGYFAAADELLRPGDQILLSLARNDGVAGGALVVAAVTPGCVAVRPLDYLSWTRSASARGNSEAAAEQELAAAI